MLAPRAVVAGALTHNGASNIRRARQTGLSLAVVNQQVLFEVTGPTVAADKISKGRTARFNRLTQNGPNCIDQWTDPPSGDAAGGSLWMNTCAKQRLAGVDISHADDDAAVHQVLLYCDTASA